MVRFRVSVLWWTIFRNTILILVYWSLSIGLTFYQNKFLKEIHLPLTIVASHLLIKFLLALLIRFIYEVATKKQRVRLDCDVWVKKLSLIGLSGGLDIGFSNWGQVFITVSLYTMSKSTAIIFILGFALLFKLEEKHWSLVLIVLMISSGLMAFTYKSTQFELEGFLLILTASFLSGLRWTLTQLVVQKSALNLKNPIDMVYHVQPWMLCSVLPFAILIEGKRVWTLTLDSQIVDGVVIGALVAFLMEIAEYLVIGYTSSLTFSIAGIFKELCTLILAISFNGDELSAINSLGLVLCFTGIVLHVIFKFLKNEENNNRANCDNSVDDMPLLQDS